MRTVKILILVLVAAVFVKCSDDDASEPVYGGFGLVLVDDSQPLGYVIKMDDEDYIIPLSPSRIIDSWDDSTRILVYFYVEEQVDAIDGNDTYEVRMLDWENILMKDIFTITPETEDSIGNDPIIMKKMWVTDNFLNFELSFWGNNETHMVNLVKQPGEIVAGDQPIELEIRHNKFDDEELFRYSAYVSFDLEPLKITGLDSVSFTVSGINYDSGTYSFDGVYKYSE